MKFSFSLSFIILCALSLLLSACANPYKKNYEPFGNVSTPIQEYKGIPKVTYCEPEDFQATLDSLKQEGYKPIGGSKFLSDNSFYDNSLIIRQARNVKAEKVVFSVFRQRDYNALQKLDQNNFATPISNDSTPEDLPAVQAGMDTFFTGVVRLFWYIPGVSEVGENVFDLDPSLKINSSNRLYVAIFFVK